MKSHPRFCFLFFRFSLSLVAFNWAAFASASNWSLGSSGERNSTSQTLSLSLDYYLEKPADDFGISSWGLSYDRVTTQSTDPVTSDPTTLVSTYGGANTTLDFDRRWSLYLAPAASNSPTEGLTSAGGTIEPSWVGETSTQFTISIPLSGTTYVQAIPETRRRSRERNSIQIVQRSVGLALSIKPIDWLKVGAAHSRYTYDRDISEFIGTLNSSNQTALLNSGLASAASSFPSSTSSFNATFYFLSTWSVYSRIGNTIIDSDDSTAMSYKLLVGKSFSKFISSVRVGARMDSYLGTNTTTGLLNFGFGF